MSASVDRIMADLRREVHKYVLVGGQEAQRGGESTAIARVRRSQWINSHLPIGWPIMSRNPIHRVVALLQKITRRFLRWYINPIVDQQNQFNEAAANALAEHQRVLGAAEARMQALQDELDKVRHSVELLQREIAALREAIHER